MSDTITGKFCYSIDEEQYHGSLNTRSAAAFHAESEIDGEWVEFGELRKYWVAECCHPLDLIMHDKLCLYRGERILEDINCAVADEILSDDPPLDLAKEDQEELGRLVIDFIRDRAAVQCYGVKNVEEHTYLAGTEELNDEIAAYVRQQLGAYIAELKAVPA